MSIQFFELQKFASEFESFKSDSASEIDSTADFFLMAHTRAPEDVDDMMQGYVNRLEDILVKRLVRGVRHNPAILDLAKSVAKDWIRVNISSSKLETKVAASLFTERFHQKALESAFLRAQKEEGTVYLTGIAEMQGVTLQANINGEHDRRGGDLSPSTFFVCKSKALWRSPPTGRAEAMR